MRPLWQPRRPARVPPRNAATPAECSNKLARAIAGKSSAHPRLVLAAGFIVECA